MATALSPLAHIQQQLKTQDNACTAHPIFIVYNKRIIYGMDSQYVDDYVWIDRESGDSCEADARQTQVFDRYERRFNQDPPGWEKTHYIEVDEFITCAFTSEAAHAFIEKRSYNYRRLFVYVDSLYRMQEMIDVREALLAGRFTEEAR